MPILWTENMSVKCEVLDEDHQYLIELVNDIEQIALTARDDNLFQAVDHFIDFSEQHFAREDELSSMVGFPLHHSHTSKILQLEARKQVLLSKKGALTQSVLNDFVRYLMDWLGIHIVTEDAQMRHTFEQCPRYFNAMKTPHLEDSNGLLR